MKLKISVIIVLVLVLIALIEVMIIVKNYQRTSSLSKAQSSTQALPTQSPVAPVVTDTPQAHLTLSSQTTVAHVTDQITIAITIDSPFDVSAVDVYLTYDPTALHFLSINAGTFFPNARVIKQKDDPVTGSLFAAVGGQTMARGNGTLFSLVFAVNEGAPLGNESIVLLDKTLIATKGNVRAPFTLPVPYTFSIVDKSP